MQFVIYCCGTSWLKFVLVSCIATQNRHLGFCAFIREFSNYHHGVLKLLAVESAKCGMVLVWVGCSPYGIVFLCFFLKMFPWKNVSIALLVFVAITSGVATLQNLDTNSNNIGIDALNVNYKSNVVDCHDWKPLPVCVLSKPLEQEIYWGHTNRLPYVYNERTHTKVVMNRLSHANNHNGKTHTKVVLNRLSLDHNYNERTHTKVEMNSHLRVLNLLFGKSAMVFKIISWWISILVDYLEKFYIEKPNVLNVPSKYYRVSKPVPVSVLSDTIVEKDIYWGHTTRLHHRTHTGTLNSYFENADWWNPVFDFLEGIAVKPNVLTKFNFKYFPIQLLFTTRKKALLKKSE